MLSLPLCSTTTPRAPAWCATRALQGGIVALGLCLGFAVSSMAADATPKPSTTPVEKVVKIDNSSFQCMRKTMLPVRHFYVDNLLGNKAGTLEAANAPKGAIYPAGSVVQLVPTEVMVKREAGFSPATADWEFFELEVNDKGSKIGKRGFAEVNNRFGKNCFACHAPARDPWDFVCETGHNCEPIPIDHKMTGALQRSDPRCGEPEPENGDTMALLKLRTMVVMGTAIGWFKSMF